MNITIDRAVLWRALEALRPQTAPSGAKRDAAFEELRAALAAQPSHTEAQRGEPVLWRYRDSEQCIKPMDGYTPGEGWTPLYDNPQPERKQVTCCAACGWESSFTSPTYYDQSLPRNQAMTTINTNKLLLEQVQDLLYRVTRWKGENHEVLTDLHDIKEAVKAVLAAPATAPDEIERLRRDAERYRWLKSAKGLTLESERGSAWTREDGTKFTPSHRLCAGGTQFGPHEHLDDSIDAAMKETP